MHTDDWGTYRNLDDYVANLATHKVAVHTDNFVDQATGVHTQDIEWRWSDLRLGIKTREGVRQTDLQAFLDFRIWCEWRGSEKWERIDNFLLLLSDNAV